jgi:hypothetical protein
MSVFPLELPRWHTTTSGAVLDLKMRLRLSLIRCRCPNPNLNEAASSFPGEVHGSHIAIFTAIPDRNPDLDADLNEVESISPRSCSGGTPQRSWPFRIPFRVRILILIRIRIRI